MTLVTCRFVGVAMYNCNMGNPIHTASRVGPFERGTRKVEVIDGSTAAFEP